MARFPLKENDVAVLAGELISGLSAHLEIYPAPPVSAEDLQNAVADFETKKQAALDAAAAAEQATADKNAAFEAMKKLMKSDIRYAENTVGDDDAKLRLIGWRAKHSARAVAAAGQCEMLKILDEGPGSITLQWKKPAEGGKPAAYKIERRKSGGQWELAGMELGTKAALASQPRGEELEYRVIAVNRTAEGPASNTVTAIL